MKKYIFLVLILPFLFYCSHNKEIDEVSSFDETELIENLATTILLPSIHTFKLEAQSLEQAVKVYKNAPSEQNLIPIKKQWIATSKCYAAIYMFNIGEVKRSFTHQILYNWPVFPESVENYLTQYPSITEETITAFGSSSKSLPGIEYLLFESDLSSVHHKLTNSSKRLNYLFHCSVQLSKNAEKLYSKWSPEEEDYLHQFIQNTNNSIGGSFNMLYNGIYNVIDNAKVTKIGKPSGLEKSDALIPEILQAQFSGISKELVLENILAAEQLFFTSNGVNISQYIDVVSGNKELSIELKTKFDDCINSLNTLDTPLNEAIYSEKDKVQNIHEALDKLREFLAVDIRGYLLIIITSTDNDGD
jgi:uncharacterized protein